MIKRALIGLSAAVAAQLAYAAETYLLEGWTFEKDGKSEVVRIPHEWRNRQGVNGNS